MADTDADAGTAVPTEPEAAAEMGAGVWAACLYPLQIPLDGPQVHWRLQHSGGAHAQRHAHSDEHVKQKSVL